MSNCSPVEFTIVGASVAGLSCAYALRESGHRVRILEKSSANLISDGCLRVPPNMSRLLQDLPGMQDILEIHGSTVNCLHFMKETSESLGRMEFPEEIMSDLGSKFYMVPHRALCSHLRELCRRDGVEFHYNVEISRIEGIAGGRPTVIAATGQRFQSDIVVGADGQKSVIRECVRRRTMNKCNEDGSDFEDTLLSRRLEIREIPSLCVSIKVADMLCDPELSTIANSSCYSLWLCKDALLIGSRCGALYNLGLNHSKPRKLVDTDTRWGAADSLPQEVIKDFGPTVHKLFGLAKSLYSTTQVVSQTPQQTDTPRSIVLVGDAAHAAPVHGTWNSALAVEDAFTLGTLFARLESHNQITRLLDGFNEIRWARNKATETSELQALLAVTVPEGPQREALYASIGLGGNAKDEAFSTAYCSWLTQFDYDAKEAVEEWWLNWGQYTQG